MLPDKMWKKTTRRSEIISPEAFACQSYICVCEERVQKVVDAFRQTQTVAPGKIRGVTTHYILCADTALNWCF